MNCPKHPKTKLKKVALDEYGCPVCGRTWLIHKLSKVYPTKIKFDVIIITKDRQKLAKKQVTRVIKNIQYEKITVVESTEILDKYI